MSLGPAYAHVNFLSNFTQMTKKISLLVPVGKLDKHKKRVRTALSSQKKTLPSVNRQNLHQTDCIYSSAVVIIISLLAAVRRKTHLHFLNMFTSTVDTCC